jgi:hypothetical protein
MTGAHRRIEQIRNAVIYGGGGAIGGAIVNLTCGSIVDQC